MTSPRKRSPYRDDRATLNLTRDVHAKLRERAQRDGKSIRETANALIEAGLKAKPTD